MPLPAMPRDFRWNVHATMCVLAFSFLGMPSRIWFKMYLAGTESSLRRKKEIQKLGERG